MPRINPVQQENATPESAQILTAVKSKMGMVPNLISTMANSPVVANAYLGFSETLSQGELTSQLREQISLAVGEANQCDYCVAAHSMLGGKAGLSEEGIQHARRGTAANEKEAVALQFAVQTVRERGRVSNESVDALRQAGFSEGEIAEIVANVALNIFTNYFNHIAETEIDFPLPAQLV